MTDGVKKNCPICPHKCLLSEGMIGLCGARMLKGGKVVDASYGQITSLSLDRIEKKPLACFRPGSMVLSVGSYGCNLSCPFCQNHEIACANVESLIPKRFIGPEQLIDFALLERDRGNIGLAYTYNEPFISWEYLRDCSILAHEKGLVNIAVTNGYVQPAIWKQSLSLVDAFNIDVKCFDEEGYRKVGAPHGLAIVKESIRSAVSFGVHVELTTLVVPGISDDEEMFKRECDWIASLDEDIPVHISRFFPSYKMYTEEPMSKEILYRFLDIAEQRLSRVFLGNI